MKKIFIAIVLLMPSLLVMAQKDSLSFSENNKYIYYHLIEQPGLSADTFQTRMLYLLKTTFPENKVSKKTLLGNISGTGKFLVLSGISAIKHTDGEIDYKFHIQYKNQKYRYWLTDFVFIPYKNDDRGNPQPQTRLAMNLENGAKKLSAVSFNRYLNETGAYGVRFGKEVKKYMDSISKQRIRINKKKIDLSENW